MKPTATELATIILMPFMYGAPKESIGGWQFMPWDLAVQRLVPEPARRSKYLRWSGKFIPIGLASPEPHAAIKSPRTTLSIEDLVNVLMYDWLSRHSRRGCDIRSFTYREITDSGPMDDRFDVAPRIQAGAFDVSDADPEMLNALAKLHAVCRTTHTDSEHTLEGRLLRAIRLHNEAHWIWVQREAARPLFTLAMALAFEALYTPEKQKLARSGDPRAFRMDEDEVKHAVDTNAIAELADAVGRFVLSTSFLVQITRSAVEAARSSTAGDKDGLRDRIIAAVRARLAGGSGIRAAMRNGVLATLRETNTDDATRSQMAKWCGKFYDLRSAIAHGDAIGDDEYRFERALWHELIARDVFHALVFESLAKLGHLPQPATKRLRDKYTRPALTFLVSSAKLTASDGSGTD